MNRALRALLIQESIRTGVELGAVHMSGAVFDSDAGIDGEINFPDSSPFISGPAIGQVKAGQGNPNYAAELEDR